MLLLFDRFQLSLIARLRLFVVAEHNGRRCQHHPRTSFVHYHHYLLDCRSGDSVSQPSFHSQHLLLVSVRLNCFKFLDSEKMKEKKVEKEEIEH